MAKESFDTWRLVKADGTIIASTSATTRKKAIEHLTYFISTHPTAHLINVGY
jgi:hypothetical protein